MRDSSQHYSIASGDNTRDCLLTLKQIAPTEPTDANKIIFYKQEAPAGAKTLCGIFNLLKNEDL
jgi:hypothetical protein